MKFFARLGWRKRRDQELDDEIRVHLAMAVRERIERGEDPAEAEASARHEFGNQTLVKEVAREMWGGAGLKRCFKTSVTGCGNCAAIRVSQQWL